MWFDEVGRNVSFLFVLEGVNMTEDKRIDGVDLVFISIFMVLGIYGIIIILALIDEMMGCGVP